MPPRPAAVPRSVVGLTTRKAVREYRHCQDGMLHVSSRRQAALDGDTGDSSTVWNLEYTQVRVGLRKKEDGGCA